MEYADFDSDDEMVRCLLTHRVDCVYFPVHEYTQVVSGSEVFEPVGAVIQFGCGMKKVIFPDQAARLKKDGILERLKIRIEILSSVGPV
jgi:hypothetical protein